MALYRRITQPASLTQYVRVLSSVETRFSRMVFPAIVEGRSILDVNSLVMREVIEPVVAAERSQISEIHDGLVEDALYYLTGNCHVRWDHS